MNPTQSQIDPSMLMQLMQLFSANRPTGAQPDPAAGAIGGIGSKPNYGSAQPMPLPQPMPNFPPQPPGGFDAQPNAQGLGSMLGSMGPAMGGASMGPAGGAAMGPAGGGMLGSLLGGLPGGGGAPGGDEMAQLVQRLRASMPQQPQAMGPAGGDQLGGADPAVLQALLGGARAQMQQQPSVQPSTLQQIMQRAGGTTRGMKAGVR